MQHRNNFTFTLPADENLIQVYYGVIWV